MQQARHLLRALSALTVSWALRAEPAHAERPSIAILGSPDALSNEIQAELGSLGFRAVLVPARQPLQTLAEVEAAARDAGAMAAVYVVTSPVGVEVWLVDRVTGKTLSRDVVRSSRQASDEDRLVAVRVVELLRASLLELELPEQTRGEVAPTPELIAAASVPTRRASVDERLDGGRERRRNGSSEVAATFLFDAGFGVSSSIGETGVTPIGTLGAFWQATPRVAVGLSSLVPIRPVEVSAREGSSSVATWELAAGARIYPFGARGSLEPSLGLGLAVLWFQIEGTRAAPRYTTSAEQLVVASPHVDASVRWRLSSDFSLRSSVGADYAFPEPGVQFAGAPVVTLGRPLVFCTLGVEFRAVSGAVGD